MAQITEDLVLGASFTISRTGASLVRVFDVGGLTPGRDTLAQAATAYDPAGNIRIPRYGEAHPSAANLFANEINAVPINGSRTAAKVTVQYGTPAQAATPGAAQIRIGGVGGHKMTAIAADGGLVAVSYATPLGEQHANYLQVPILVANTLLEFTRVESASPLRLSEQYRRTISKSAWQGGDAGTWLCRGIDAAGQGSGRFEVRYTFEYDPDGWDRIEYFVDPFSGKIPDDVAFSSNNDKGIARIKLYKARDFSLLGLPNAF